MWTAEQVQEIKGYVARGLTRSDIARVYGVTRNAMVGLCYRHAITGANNQAVGTMVATARRQRARLLKGSKRPPKLMPSAAERTTADRWVRKAKPIKFKPVEIIADEPAPLLVSILDLTLLKCHNVTAETNDDCLPLYCGHPTQAQSSYCEFHHNLFHTTWRRRR